MSIWVYTGKTGDGKTYHVMSREIIPALKTMAPGYTGQVVSRIYTNIDGINSPDCIRMQCELAGITPEDRRVTYLGSPDEIRNLLVWDLMDKEGKKTPFEHNSLFVIDEAQMIYDSREFKNTTKPFRDLLGWHRHFGLNFVFITQAHKNMDTVINRQCSYCYQIKNLTMLSTLIGSFYIINVRQNPSSPVLSTMYGRLNPAYYHTYKSFAHADVVRGGLHTHQTKSYLSGPLPYAVCGLMLYSCYGLAKNGVWRPKIPHKPKYAISNPVPTVPSFVPPPSVVVPTLAVSTAPITGPIDHPNDWLDSRDRPITEVPPGCVLQRRPYGYYIDSPSFKMAKKGIYERLDCKS